MPRRRLLSALAAASLAALAIAAPASAATRMVATATPATPQLDPAGSVQHLQLTCAAEDKSSVYTTVRCWKASGGSVFAALAGPAAVATGRVSGSALNAYTLCAEATFRMPSGYTSTTGVRCSPSGIGGLAIVTG